ncbi:unnamed protein product [Toxocara canis]|uniref:Uncharacterized protein n=1 Tax=Toxocara canis TaxID=6265 RepID=A0A3P7F0J5_TOXCA|nr:unnamed protein product [Toxocara canis]
MTGSVIISGRHSASIRQRRSSTSTDDKDLIKKIETENEEPQEGDPHYVYNRLSASVTKYRYLHKLDDETLSAYMEQLRRQLNKLERFREVSFGPHSVAKHQSEPHVSWFFRRRSLPSLSDSEQPNTLHEPLRSVQSLKFRSRFGKSTSPRKLDESHDSRSTYPLTAKRRRNSESNRLPPIGRNGNSGTSTGSSGAPKVPPKNRTVLTKRRSNSRKRDEPVRIQKIKPKEDKSEAVPALAVVGVSALAGGTAAAIATAPVSSTNSKTPSPTPPHTGIPTAGEEAPETQQDETKSAIAVEGSVDHQNDAQTSTAMSLLSQNEPTEEVENSNDDDAHEELQQTHLYDLEQQQKVCEEQIPTEHLEPIENEEAPEVQPETEAFEPEVIKAESPPHEEGSPVNDVNEASSEEFGKTGANVITELERPEDANPEPEAHKKEMQLQETSPSTFSVQTPLEYPIAGAEVSDQNQSSPEPSDDSKIQKESMDEEGREEVSSLPGSIVAGAEEDGEEREETPNYGDTKPAVTHQLSGENESGGDIVASPPENVDEKEAKDDERMAESRIEQEAAVESAASPTVYSDEPVDEINAAAQPQAASAYPPASGEMPEHDDNSENKGDVEGSEKEQQDAKEVTESFGEEADVQRVESPEPDHEQPFTAQVADVENPPVQSSDADEAPEANGESGTGKGDEELEGNQTEEERINDMQQEHSRPPSAPAESPDGLQQAGVEQSEAARPPPASSTIAAEAKESDAEQQSIGADMIQQPSEVNNVENTSGGMSWDIKEEAENASEGTANQQLDSVAQDSNVQQPEIPVLEDSNGVDEVADPTASGDKEGALSARKDESTEDLTNAEVAELRSERRASLKEAPNTKDEEASDQAIDSEAKCPEPHAECEADSAAAETEGSPLPNTASSEVETSHCNTTDDGNDQPETVHGSQLEQASGGMSWEVDDVGTKGEVGADAVINDGMGTASLLKETDKGTGEEAQSGTSATEAAEPSQKLVQLESPAALEGNEEHSDDLSAQTAAEADGSLQLARANSEENLTTECQSQQQMADLNSTCSTLDASHSASALQNDGTEDNIGSAEVQPDSGAKVSPQNSRGTEMSGGENSSQELQRDREDAAAAASEDPSQVEAKSFQNKEAANLDNIDAKQSSDTVTSEIRTDDNGSQKQLNLVDENANHPEAVDGEYEQQDLSSRKNGNNTDRSEDEETQHSEQSPSPLQMPKNTPNELSDEESRGSADMENKIETADLARQTTEAEPQTSV